MSRSLIDRRGWPPGPWDDEPDELEFVTLTGMSGAILRNDFGVLCGYVAVPVGHPCHGQDCGALDCRVHGGVTYAKNHHPLRKPDGNWWVGFDCGHSEDLQPALLALPLAALLRDIAESMTYRQIGYVRQQCESLAQDLTREAWKVS